MSWMTEATENNHNEFFVGSAAELSLSVHRVITSHDGLSTNKWLALSRDTVSVLSVFNLGGEWGGRLKGFFVSQSGKCRDVVIMVI